MSLALGRAGMAAPGNLSEEQVHCSICLDVFTDPVSIACGHNFCHCCIVGYWRSSPLLQCPMCKKSFHQRPDISVNTVLRDIAQQFKEIRLRGEEQDEERWTMERRRRREEDEERLLEKDPKELRERQELERRKKEESKEKRPFLGLQEELPQLEPPPPAPQTSRPPSPSPSGVVAPSRSTTSPPKAPPKAPPSQTSPPPSPQIAPPHSPAYEPWEEVLCDVCLGEGRPRALKSCLVCLTSYCEEHLRSHAVRFTKHQLMEPLANMEERMCPKHQRLLELFCKKDQSCVCVLCTETDHRAHYTVPVEREWTEKKAQLKRTEVEVQHMIQERLQKVEQIKHSVELHKASARREVEDGVQVLSELQRCVVEAQEELLQSIQEQQRRVETRAQDLITHLQQEVHQLSTRNQDLENLGRSDHIHFLQGFPSLVIPPSVRDWSGTTVPSDISLGVTRRVLLQLGAALSRQVDKLADSEIKKLLKYSVDLTLDPDTANPWLQLSQDRRQVRHLGAWQDLPDTPERFDTVVIVLGREGFSSGRRYWEVQVGDKDDWYLGVARASVNRKGRISVGAAHGYWALAMKKGQEYRASASPPVLLTLDPRPQRVGVYVDYEAGQLSFYDVRARTHIYTFKDKFTEKIFPFFYLYCCDKASDTMVICPASENVPAKQS